MARQVVIVHGWSDTSNSFKPLAAFLDKNGFEAVPLWLGDYLSLEDDVRVEDVAKRMQEVLLEYIQAGELDKSFDVIVHSTGALVVRQWLTMYYPDGKNCPIRRLLMLAPANFGSKLASLGQSMLGRVIKGWNNWFHTGKEMLATLDLASRYQWDLAQRDLFALGDESAPSPYGKTGVLPFIITGTHPYPSSLRQIVNENGADGTVRVPAANLNVHGITIDFAADETNPTLTEWPLRHGDLEFPFAVLPDRTHGSIITPEDNDVKSADANQARLGELILQALNCPGPSQYAVIQKEWQALSEATAELALDPAKLNEVFPKPKWWEIFKGETPTDFFHQYLQVIVTVVDDHGADVPDFFLEFFGPDAKSDREAVYFHSQVLEAVAVNGPRRCFYVDRTDLVQNYYELIPAGGKKAVAMSISAAPPGDNVSYFGASKVGAAGELVVHDEAGEHRRLRRNCTHFVKIVIPRTPKNNVFKLTKLAPGSR